MEAKPFKEISLTHLTLKFRPLHWRTPEPATFKKLIQQFNELFPQNHMHFRIGIPTGIGQGSSVAIARAVDRFEWNAWLGAKGLES